MNHDPDRKIDDRPADVSFWQAFLFWLKLGFISFGGPAGQIAIMHQELVERRRWISERRFLHALNYCMVLPGPSPAAGHLHRLADAPHLGRHRRRRAVRAALAVHPDRAVVGLHRLRRRAAGGRPVLRHQAGGHRHRRAGGPPHRLAGPEEQWLWAIAAASFVAIFALNVPFPAIVRRRRIGYFGGRIAPDKFKAGGGHGKADKSFGRALIDDDTPTPACPFAGPLVKVALIGGLLWLVPMGLLTASYGWDTP
jgi:chromate transporter